MKSKYFKLLIISTLICSCSEDVQTSDANKIEDSKETIESNNTIKHIETEIPKNTMSSKAVFNESIGWGYEIYKGSKLIVKQEHIPAIQGMRGFGSKESAEKVAEFIIQKINKGIFPPTLTPNELDSLGVFRLK
jgi:hypothetical protein